MFTLLAKTMMVVNTFSVPQLLAMMVDLEDIPEWSKSDEIEDEDYERYSIPSQLLSKFSHHIKE